MKKIFTAFSLSLLLFAAAAAQVGEVKFSKSPKTVDGSISFNM